MVDISQLSNTLEAETSVRVHGIQVTYSRMPITLGSVLW